MQPFGPPSLQASHATCQVVTDHFQCPDRPTRDQVAKGGSSLASTTSHECFTPSGSRPTLRVPMYLIPYPRAQRPRTPPDARETDASRLKIYSLLVRRISTKQDAQFDTWRRRAQLHLVQHPDSQNPIPSHPTHTHLGERSFLTNHLSIASDHRLQPVCTPHDCQIKSRDNLELIMRLHRTIISVRLTSTVLISICRAPRLPLVALEEHLQILESGTR
ncbi:hypothetical protein QBC41DRAFT_6826 [Cercophora samala]|uniref:Uncharacterized protein n=1 Tax=Cercophora samala TaxID=330535 RepID=A0AA39ZKM4_9PEZI|nr:hypothetical protein QBC41DRAFT_6826 [Cercophora samala]